MARFTFVSAAITGYFRHFCRVSSDIIISLMVKEIDPSLRLHFDTPQERGEILCELDRISRGFEGLLKPSIIGPTNNEKQAFRNIRDSIRESCPPTEVALGDGSSCNARRVIATIVLGLVEEGIVSFNGDNNDWRKTRKEMRAWQVQSPPGKRRVWAVDHGDTGRNRMCLNKHIRRKSGPKKGRR